MADMFSSDAVPEPIGTLIDSFFAALKASPDLASMPERPAEMAYELDQVVSTYLEDHQLSAEAYHQIEHEVLNTLAVELQADHPDPHGLGFPVDAAGNVDPFAVFSALDEHLADLQTPHGFCLDNQDLGSALVAELGVDLS
jgi:hypothetical protein